MPDPGAVGDQVDAIDGPAVLRPAAPGDASATAECVDAAYAQWVPRLGRKPWPVLRDYSEVIANELVFVALYARIGYVPYERPEEQGFRRVFMHKMLR